MDVDALRQYEQHDINKDAETLERKVAEAVKKGNGIDFSLFDEIAKWKFRGQYKRASRHWNDATRNALQSVTKLALSDFGSIPADQLLELRVKLLTSIPGVGTGFASAILGLAFPELYCVIDFRGWRRVFPDHRKSHASFARNNGTPQLTFTVGEYCTYVKAVSEIAKKLGWSVRKTDTAIWAYDEAMRQ